MPLNPRQRAYKRDYMREYRRGQRRGKYGRGIRTPLDVQAARHVAEARRWRASNPDKVREITRRTEARPERIAQRHVHSSLRQVRQQLAPGSYTAEEFIEKCALLGNVCFYCGEAKPLGPDHKVPLSRGGSNDIANIVPCCLSCNVKKGRKTAREYLEVA